VLNNAKRPAKNNPRAKWEYLCASCGGYFLQREVEVDHLIPCGTLRSYEDLPQFVERLFCGEEHLRVVCKTCHKAITKEEKDAAKLK
jgi:DNA-directed RNA polymerase subunit RPC12/RpoP